VNRDEGLFHGARIPFETKRFFTLGSIIFILQQGNYPANLILLMKNNTTYVFIPGGWHGGWAYDAVTAQLEQEGKKCISLTLPGLEPQPGPPGRMINLNTHIEFVTNILIKQDIRNVILCGHSYAGLVITGVADAIPERIAALVYIDAYIPEDGDSCWSLTTDIYRDRFVTGAGNDGFNVAVPPGADDRRRPHPLATFMQQLRLTGNVEKVVNRAFIYLGGWSPSPFVKYYETVKHSPHWHVETIDCGHNVMRDCPNKLVDVLYRLEDQFI
jgi:pimeloyl-ACP methyl ester carboxylesterase